MTINDLFAFATRNKLRFPISGSISVEDVWDLPLKAKREGSPSLDELAQTLDDAVQTLPRRSFVDDSEGTSEKSVAQLKLDLVLFVIDVKKREAAGKQAAVVRESQARQLDELIARKQNQELEGKSVEELRALRDSLGEARG